MCLLNARSRIRSYIWRCGLEAFLLYSPSTASDSVRKASSVYFRFSKRSDSIFIIVSSDADGPMM